MDEFVGKRVLVTGGSKGIGLGIARYFVEAGAKVAICGRKEANLVKAREQLGEVLTVAAHLGKAEEVERYSVPSIIPSAVWISWSTIWE